MKKRPHLVPCLISSAMLFGALGHWPYGYYKLLRWVTCGAALFVAYHQFDQGREWIAWIFGMTALLFNPLIPIHLSREIWVPINVIAGLAFLVVGMAPPAEVDTQMEP